MRGSLRRAKETVVWDTPSPAAISRRDMRGFILRETDSAIPHPAEPTVISRMLITRIETLHLRPRWLVVRVHTDAELTGLGEATLEGRCLTVEAALHEMS